MSNVEAMRELVVELDAASTDLPPDLSRAMQVAMRGATQMRSRLELDIETALRPALEVVLTGAPVKDHEIRVDALSRLLHGLQESVSSVAQALTGKATAFASLPGLLRDETALSLSAVYAGSFGATLRGPVDRHQAEMAAIGQEPLLPPEEQETLLDRAMDTVLDIMTMASGAEVDDEPIVEAVLPLGPRAYKHLLNLTETIVDQEMAADLEWKHLGAEPRKVRLDKPTARRLSDVLTMNRVTEKHDTIEGRLGTVSDIRNRVEIEVDTPDGVRVIPASVSDDVVPELARYYTLRVSASVVVRTSRSAATGLERHSYVVLGLATMNSSQGQIEAEPPADEGSNN